MIEFYQDKQDKWRWRITADNGEIVGASSQGFSTRASADTNLRLLTSMLKAWDWK